MATSISCRSLICRRCPTCQSPTPWAHLNVHIATQIFRSLNATKVKRHRDPWLLAASGYNRVEYMGREESRHAWHGLDIAAPPARNVSTGEVVTRSENERTRSIVYTADVPRHGD